jgi:hypothetical protein
MKMNSRRPAQIEHPSKVEESGEVSFVKGIKKM